MGKVTLPKGFEHKKAKHWYLVANRVDALIYEGKLNGSFHFLKRYQNPKGRLREKELGGAKGGRSFSNAGTGLSRSFEPHTRPHEEVASSFARKIAGQLDLAMKKEEFTDLVIVAEPHFLGMMNRELSKQVKTLVRHEVPNEWKRGSDLELEDFLRKKLAS